MTCQEPTLYDTFDGIHPCIDMAPLLAPEEHPPDRKQQTVLQIGNALQQRGYFYAQHVDILSAEYLASIYQYSKRLHTLPLAKKKVYKLEKGGVNGYSGPDVGHGEYPSEPGTYESVRAWDYSRTRLEPDLKDSLFPDETVIDPPYEQVLDELYERQNVLARALMEAFAEFLGLSPHVMMDKFEGSSPEESGDFGTIRLLYYPGMTDAELANKANVGISAHTDFEAFTLMHQSAQGLQLLPPKSSNSDEEKTSPLEWIDAPVRPGEFVVIVGDVLERCTNGILKATPHRVVKTPHPRWSIIRFNGFASSAMIEPLTPFVNARAPAAYTPVSMKVHMETSLKNSESEIGIWDEEKQESLTANYVYIDGKDHREVQ